MLGCMGMGDIRGGGAPAELLSDLASAAAEPGAGGPAGEPAPAARAAVMMAWTSSGVCRRLPGVKGGAVEPACVAAGCARCG